MAVLKGDKMSLKSVYGFFLLVLVTSCSSPASEPSEGAIQTAIAKTEAARPVDVTVPANSSESIVTPTPANTSTPENTPTATPDIPATQTATRAVWLELDDDGDGLKNALELELGTAVNSKDTDNDGLSDFEEHTRYDTDPLNSDTDGDTLTDGSEVADDCLSPLSNDTDLDGIPDNLDTDSCVGLTPTAEAN
jgi:hypothetical protein